VEICRAVTVRLVGIARNMTWYVPRQPLAWTLEGLPQSDLCQANISFDLFLLRDTALRTRRAGKEGQRWDDGIGWDD
jgi:hypothetical protein